MPNMNHMVVLTAAFAAFIIGGVWYSPLLLGNAYARLRGVDPSTESSAMPVREIVGELVRWLVITYGLAYLIVRLGIADLIGAVVFAVGMWVVIYTALAGSVLHEGTPWRLYAIHAGDGLVKLLVISAIVALWGA
jgi:hypothetical protein